MNARQRRTIKRKVKKCGLFWPGTPVSKREARHIKARWMRAWPEQARYFDEAHKIALSQRALAKTTLFGDIR